MATTLKMRTLTTHAQAIIVNRKEYDVLLVPTDRVIEFWSGKVVDGAYDVLLTDYHRNYAILMFTKWDIPPEELMKIAVNRAPSYISHLHTLWNAPKHKEEE